MYPIKNIRHLLIWPLLGAGIILLCKSPGCSHQQVETVQHDNVLNTKDRVEDITCKESVVDDTALKIPTDPRVAGYGVAFSPDSQLLAAGNTIWKLPEWTKILSFDNQASVGAMFFSPDKHFLYVLGGANTPTSFRLDINTGLKTPFFTAHKGGITSASTSNDGKHVVTVSSYDDTVRLWKLPSGKLISTNKLPEYCYHAAISHDGRWFIRNTTDSEFAVESLISGKSFSLSKDELQLKDFTFTLDSKYLIVYAHDLGDNILLLYDVVRGFELINSIKLSRDRHISLAACSNSQSFLLTSPNGLAEIFSLPDLKILKTLQGLAKADIESQEIAFSPDGNLIAIGMGDEPLRLFEGKSFERILPPKGHGGKPKAIFFSSDGKKLISTASDNTVCIWDTSNGSMLYRFSLPDGYKVASAREDGRFLVCYESEVLDNTNHYYKNYTNRARILDSYSGNIISQPVLPVGTWQTRIYWLDDHNALVATGNNLCLFDYLTGKILSDLKINRSDIGNGMGFLTEDKKHIYVIEGGGKSSRVTARLINIRTGGAHELGERIFQYNSINKVGAIPGGQFLYVVNYDFVRGRIIEILNRRDLKLVAQRELGHTDFRNIVFSKDGSRFAEVTKTVIPSSKRASHNQNPDKIIISIQETLSGKSIKTICLLTDYISELVFSPDARKLAAISDEGNILIWDMSK